MPTLIEAVRGAAKPAREAWRWWIAELAQLVPGRISAIGAPRATSEIHLDRHSVTIDRVIGTTGERFVENRSIDALDDAAWEELAGLVEGTRSRIVLSHPDVYTIELTLPRAAGSRLRSAVALQLGEISPVEPALIDWTLHSIRRDTSSVTASVTMAKSQRLAHLANLFSTHGIPPPPIGVLADDRFVPIVTGFDASRSAPMGRLSRRLVVASLALLASIPVITLAGANILAATNEEQAAILAKAIAPKVAADRRAREAELLRRAVAPLARIEPASSTLDALATAVPATAYARSVERMEDGALHFTLETPDPDVIRPALEEALPALREVNQAPGDDGHLRVDYVTGPR
jgi:hypothetical protein